MRKNFTLAMAVILGLFTASVNAQTLKHWCASDEVNNALDASNPAIKQARIQMQDYIADFVKTNPNGVSRKSNGVISYVIPVVFHVIHNCGPENISEAQIYDEIHNLNRNYQKLRGDSANIYSTFQALNADVEIEFRLAKKDPNGNCTNGIDRIQSMLTYNADDASKLNPWPRNKYLNIWTIYNFGASHSGAAAYAYRPVVGLSSLIDGIITLSNYVGSIGTSNSNQQYTLTHEIGHHLGLPHTWGSTNQPGVACGDDGISDTPLTKGFLSCPTASNASVCNPPIVENYQNYMDYSYCYYMFTNGQKAAMHATLNSSVCGRNNLSAAANLLATGTDGAAYVCIPTASFGTCDPSTQRFVCEGGNLTFKDQSFNIDTIGVTYSWFSNGANPSTVTGASAVLNFPTAGVYDVALTVTNSAGTDTYTISNYVVVSAISAALATPLVEGFESTVIPGTADWYVDNSSAGSSEFQTSTVAPYAGSYSLRLQNHSGNTTDTRDAIVTPAFDLSNTTLAKAYFRVAYANRATGSGDVMKVFVSSDCGLTWVQRYIKTAANLQTVTNIVTASFTPTSTQWRLDSVNLGAFSNDPNVRLKFEFAFDTGNNLYIDNINISGVVGFDEIYIDADEMTLSPNPAHGLTTLGFKLINTKDVTITISDVLGKELQKITEGNLYPGSYQYEIKTPEANGVYFVRIVSGNQFITKKLIVQ